MGLIFKSVVYRIVISLPHFKSHFYTFYNFLLIIFQYLTSHTGGALSGFATWHTLMVHFQLTLTHTVPCDVGLEVSSSGVGREAVPPAPLHLVLLSAVVAIRLISLLLMSEDRNPLGRHGNGSTSPTAVCLCLFLFFFSFMNRFHFLRPSLASTTAPLV